MVLKRMIDRKVDDIMRRKILLLLLASVLVLSLCGCKKGISSENVTIQDTQQDDIQTEEQNIEQEEQTEKVTNEQDPDYMGDMYDSFASDYVEKIDLNYAENLSDESDDTISTQLNIAEEWGCIDEKDFQFINELDDVVYYYQIENFHFDVNKMTQPVIDTLNRLCEEKEKEYKEWGDSLMEADWKHRLAVENGEVEADEEEFEGENSYNKWFFQYISYIGEDYVSLVYCEITGMGGPNEYNTLEAYTIDCTTGNILTASEILGIQNDAALRCQISDKMGTEQFLTWDELGYYITDKAIVFFGKEYWMRGTYEDVIVWR